MKEDFSFTCHYKNVDFKISIELKLGGTKEQRPCALMIWAEHKNESFQFFLDQRFLDLNQPELDAVSELLADEGTLDQICVKIASYHSPKSPEWRK
jgi:hypothetical protein